MIVEVILLERITNLGRVGDRVSVKPGYGRNFLVPKAKAIYATPENIKAFELKRSEYEAAQTGKLENAQNRAKQLSSIQINLELEADPSGKLYGSVSPKVLADAITKAGCEVHKEEIKLPHGPIRHIGDHEITLQLHSEVVATVLVKVTGINV